MRPNARVRLTMQMGTRMVQMETRKQEMETTIKRTLKTKVKVPTRKIVVSKATNQTSS